ncbi:MAG TPA: vanadium-dependent haloperoxidase [Opitutus sp.]|nr:vanadium-dependent haloperoxidase [Opitutus sp.]
MCLFFSGPNVRADVVTEWNHVMEETVLASNPFLQTRSAAITQLAVFEAVNSITGEFEPYLEKLPAPSGASAEAAAVAAAHRALVTLYPNRAATLDALRATSLASIPAGPSRDNGMAVGVAAADAILAVRADDGSSAVVPYTPGSKPGDWQPTPPASAPALYPSWGSVTPFAIESGARFRPGSPPSIRSAKYARDYEEVKAFGSVNSPRRSQEKTDVARFYAVVLGIDSYNPAARQVSAVQGKTLSENARMFALLAMALSDSLIASMDAKYHYNYWRPVTAIRHADTDANRKTEPDDGFLPLITTPPFPSYPSNHASLGGAARAVLEEIFGESGHAITLSSAKIPEVVRHYTSWKQITDDIDDARICGGIHFRFDQEAGARLGRAIGKDIIQHELRPTKRGREPLASGSAIRED